MENESCYIAAGGMLRGSLPQECIADCTVPGADASAACQHWREALDFTVPVRLAIDYLAEFGAWTREEMEAWGHDRLAETVLWILCGNEKEEPGTSAIGIAH